MPGSRDPALPGKPTIPPHHPHGPPGHPVPPAVTGAPPQPPPIGAVPHPADLLRGAGAAAPPLFAPGLPRPGPPGADPLNPFGLPRPPYPSLFGPSPLGGYSRCCIICSFNQINNPCCRCTRFPPLRLESNSLRRPGIPAGQPAQPGRPLWRPRTQTGVPAINLGRSVATQGGWDYQNKIIHSHFYWVKNQVILKIFLYWASQQFVG